MEAGGGFFLGRRHFSMRLQLTHDLAHSTGLELARGHLLAHRLVQNQWERHSEGRVRDEL
jgi:hypothetical protein